MPTDDVKEWAIRDEATGEYMGLYSLPVVACSAIRFGRYIAGFRFTWLTPGDLHFRDSARIIPAPPREMTDAEAEAWFLANNLFVIGVSHEQWGIWHAYSHINTETLYAFGSTLFDAIRAARRKLEGK